MTKLYFSRAVLTELDPVSIQFDTSLLFVSSEGLASGYAFFEDFLWRAQRSGLRITEIPITFTDRKIGESKVTPIEIVRGARDLLRIAVRTWMKR